MSNHIKDRSMPSPTAIASKLKRAHPHKRESVESVRAEASSTRPGAFPPQGVIAPSIEGRSSAMFELGARPLGSSARGATGGLWDILFQRYLTTVRDLVFHLSEDAVRRALEQNTGLESLALGMGEHAIAVASESAHERTERILDLHKAQASLVKRAGGAVTALQAAGLLGKITRQAVEKRRERGTVLAVMASGEYHYPLFQFESPAVLAGLPEVLRAFTIRNGWTQLSVLLSPQDALDGRSVVEALKQGDVEGAVGVAASFGDTGG